MDYANFCIDLHNVFVKHGVHSVTYTRFGPTKVTGRDGTSVGFLRLLYDSDIIQKMP